MLERPISVSGHVKDSLTGEPIVAKISMEDITFPNDEEFFSEPTFGRYHLFLPPGSYKLEFSSDNYNSKTQQVTVTETSSQIFEIERPYQILELGFFIQIGVRPALKAPSISASTSSPT